MMAFTRFAWARKYVKGDSNLYAYWDVESDKIMLHSIQGDALIDKEDLFELIVSVLKRAGIDLGEKQLKKLASFLEVELRERALTFDELLEDMMRKCGKREVRW